MRWRRSVGPLTLASIVLLAGCSQLEQEAAVLDDLVLRVKSDDFDQRRAATAELLQRDPLSMRHLVVPRLALESALTPLHVTSSTGKIFKGRVTGGDYQTLELRTAKHVAEGALIAIPVAEIRVLRLFPR